MTTFTTTSTTRILLTSVTISLAILLAACSDSGNNNSGQGTETSTLGVPGADNENVVQVPAASVEGPITGAPVLVGTFFDLTALGYAAATGSPISGIEYFVSGTANKYTNVNELQSDGKWQIAASERAQYKTRVVVIRPENPADFNGTVFVEWLNVSAGFDSPPDWLSSHTELTRSGFAWVGVSAQKVGVDALIDGSAAAILPGSIKDDRYDSLSHPGDDFSYDIFSQVAQAIRTPGEVSILGNLVAEHLIGAGESQSAGRMVTYANAFAPIHALYDGYLIHSRTEASAGLQQENFCEAAIPTPSITRVRDDLGTPVIMIQPETDLFILRSHPSNQDDSENFRLWELAGTSHADLYTFVINRFDVGTDPAIAAVVEELAPVPGIIDCTLPVNAGPMHFIVNAAIRALNTWIIDGTAPAMADRLEVAGEPPAIVRDEWGNARGGIRTPYVDTPIATLEGEGQPQPDFSGIDPSSCEINIDNIDFCFLAGTTRLFDAGTLRSLYADNDAYVEALNASTDEAVAKGFLLPEDAALIKAHAANSDIFAP